MTSDILALVADNERPAPKSSGRISPEGVAAYLSQSYDFEDEFLRLKHENPVVALAIMQASERGAPDIAQKRAFARGALFIYGLLRHHEEAASLKAHFELSSTDDVSDGEVPPP